MNINKFDIDFSNFSQYNINFSHVHVRNKIICANLPIKYNRDWFLFSNGESYLSIDVYGCITKVKDCRKAYLNDNLIALEAFYDNIPDSLLSCGKWCLETFENANNLRIRKTLGDKAQQKINKEIEAEVDAYFEKYIASSIEKSKRISFNKEIRAKVFEKSNGRCAICGMPLSLEHHSKYNYATIDHIIPLDKGGKNEMSNYQATCARCNQIKTNIMPEMFKNNVASVMFDGIINDSNFQNAFLKFVIKKKVKAMILCAKAAIF